MPEQLVLAFRILDLVGVVLNGILGGLIARRRRFDITGFAVLAIVSALGGGMIRDTLLQVGRPVALVDPAYLPCALAGAAVAYLVRIPKSVGHWVFPLADGLVLGAWAVTGTTKALAYGLDWLPALLMGLVTAVGGGMVRDIAVGQVPQVFGGNTLYATPALLAASLTVLGGAIGAPAVVTMIVATLLGASLMLLARILGWRLPVHGDGTVTMTRRQLATLIRRVERRTRRPRPRRQQHPPAQD